MTQPEVNEKALSDDGSYEFVEEPDHRINDFEEHISAAGSKCNYLSEYSDGGSDDDSRMDNANDHSDDSYEFVDSKEVCEHVTQCKEDLNIDTESSDMETGDDIQQDGIVQYKAGAYHIQVDGRKVVFPECIKLRSEMELKDVVKAHVLHFLPAKSIIKFRVVSKEWDKWLASPFLSHTQSHRFQKISGFFQGGIGACNFISLDKSAYGVPSRSLSFLPELFVIKSSCNGLLLCRGLGEDRIYYICNPTTKEWKILPQPQYYHGDESKCVLVFEPSPLNFEAHFQVICALSLPLFEGPIKLFDIYDSVTKSWNISTVDCVELGDSELIDNGFYLNGIAYWQTSGDEMLAVDLKNGLCGLQPLPHGTKCICLLDGELCYITIKFEIGGTNKRIVEIYGDYLSLKRTVKIGVESLSELKDFQILSPFGNDFARFLLQHLMKDYKGKYLDDAHDYDRGRSFPYVNSLVSLAHN